MVKNRLNRRAFVTGLVTTSSALVLGGCDALSQSPKFRDLLGLAEGATELFQRLILSTKSMAREYSETDLSTNFKVNGNTDVDDPAYKASAAQGFADFKLVIEGLVERPAALSLAELRKLPSRTQITRHDCVEGWSAVGKWQGAVLGPLLQTVGLKPDARYLVFHCFDSFGPGEPYYESIDLIDAFHPQTILAHDMNGAPLSIGHGAPLRLRVERQLGYKHAKYIKRIEAVSTFAMIAGGKGGYWEDRGYEWYAGI